MRVRFKAVVVQSELREPWHQLDQVDPTAVVALPNSVLRDVVSASSNPGSNPCHVQFGTTQSHEPHAHFDSNRQRLLEKRADGVPTKRRFEREGQAFGDRPFQEAFSLMPGSAVRIRDGNTRIGG